MANDASKRCGLDIDGDVVHLAWSDASPNADAGDQGMPIDIHHRAFDHKTASSVLKTKHDTAKNSIGNIRQLAWH